MPSLSTILKAGCFLIPLIFGTHYIRTWAFNRYEAVTYECSCAALLLSVLHILKYGYSRQAGLLTAALLAAFIGNALCQWHFYMVLQRKIRAAFDVKAGYLAKARDPKVREKASSINSRLLTMASVAIMPSFSRFIEESKLFNNPGSFIGLVKSIMKRQRFLKKKYLMREVFAECVNLIGPCKPGIDSMMYDDEHVVPGAVHANDLALDYPDEKKGLFSFDVLGFGALIAIWFFLALHWERPVPIRPGAAVSAGRQALLLLLVLVVLTGLSRLLRHFAFARYESIGYELSFSALVAAGYFLVDGLAARGGAAKAGWAAFGAAAALFLAASYVNRRTDRRLHRRIDGLFDELIHKISPEYETNRVERRFLQDLKTISLWAVVPFPGDGKASRIIEKLFRSDRVKAFEEINRKKREMPVYMNEIVGGIVADKALLRYHDGRGGEEKEITSESFNAPPDELRRAKRIIDCAGILGAAAVAACVWFGVF